MTFTTSLGLSDVLKCLIQLFTRCVVSDLDIVGLDDLVLMQLEA